MTRVMFQCTLSTNMYDEQIHKSKLPIGVFVEPIALDDVEVKILDLSNGCVFTLTRKDFDNHFKRWGR